MKCLHAKKPLPLLCTTRMYMSHRWLPFIAQLSTQVTPVALMLRLSPAMLPKHCVLTATHSSRSDVCLFCATLLVGALQHKENIQVSAAMLHSATRRHLPNTACSMQKFQGGREQHGCHTNGQHQLTSMACD